MKYIRRHWIVGLLVLAAAVGFGVIALSLFSEDRGLTENNLHRITTSMSQARVESILGTPTSIEPQNGDPAGNVLIWRGSFKAHTGGTWSGSLRIYFDLEGRQLRR